MELSPAQVAGGALAAASAAVAASVFGVYGTIIGAVAGSIVASVGGAIYTHSFRRGKAVITQVRVNRTGRLAAVEGEYAPHEPAPTDQPAETTEDGHVPRNGWRRRLAGMNPKTIAITTACVLAVSLGAITGIEALIDKPISSAFGGGDKGGSSLDRAFKGARSEHGGTNGDTSPTPTATVTTTKSPAGTPTSSSSTRPTKPTTSTSTGAPATSKPTTPPPTTSTGLPTGPPSKSVQESP